ncbi:hypothetical protein TIFTF001_047227 [Ficus carica]|uniref:TF-B3 domain-containing protein n=1 Tax=Ficus carica TaxID=3494 RepID=A0AA87Z3J0_FICCA|nr:hypothetical protein TIFTF001_047227 [Ficus carica]
MAPKCHEKILTSTDINQKLIVPMDLLGNLFPDPNPDSERIPLSFKDERWKDYTFYLKVRSRKTGQIRYDKKPEFMFKERRAFVVEKKLKVGEKIFLWWDDRGSLRIRAHRCPLPWKLLGTNFLH